MTAAAQASSLVSARYAAALIEAAQGAKKLDKVGEDCAALGVMISQSEDLRLLIRSPLNGADRQQAALFALADKAKFQTVTRNFIGVLIRNRRLSILPSVLKAFQSEISRRRGEITVHVETAQDMSAAQAKALQDSLSKATGANVQIKARVEPSILGGMIVTVGSQMIDDSVRRKLERLKGAMSRRANEDVGLKEVV